MSAGKTKAFTTLLSTAASMAGGAMLAGWGGAGQATNAAGYSTAANSAGLGSSFSTGAAAGVRRTVGGVLLY